jgi:protein-tyrosine phosphatase
MFRLISQAVLSDPGVSFITDHILIGNREDAQSVTKLIELGVSHIINATQQLPNYHPDRFVYCTLPLLDAETEDVRPHLPIAFAAIDDAVKGGTRCFVHCIAGKYPIGCEGLSSREICGV